MRTGDIKTINSRCEVKIYSYKKKVLGDGQDVDEGELLDAEVFEIKGEENSVIAFDYNKSFGAPSGTFNLTLAPNKNWLNVVRPGDWITVSLSQAGDKDRVVRCIGNVDRVSQSENVQEGGGRSVTFNVSGRDFGKVFEKYSVWFNIYDETYVTQSVLLGKQGALAIKGTSKDIISQLISLFLGGKLEGQLQKQLDAFRIPSQLSQDMDANGKKFADILELKLDDVPGYKGLPVEYLKTGTLWDLCKGYGNLVVNELFLEHVKIDKKVKPAIFLRIYPFTQKGFSIPSEVSAATFFEDLEAVEITGNEILDSNIGTADHESFNVFLLSGSVSSERNVQEAILGLDPDFPFVNVASVRRNGMYAYIQSTPFVATTDTAYSPAILKGWNLLIKHWFLEAMNLEAGQFTIIGNSEVRLGKRLFVKDGQLHKNKHFYIEGYQDSWSYPGIWTQTINVSRGKVQNNGQSSLVVEKGDRNTELSGRTDYKGGRL